MNAPSAGPILNHVCRLVARQETRRSDRDLLEHYLQRHDETAFAELVHRHGGMVLSVCRSVLRDRQEAEDAMQATFIVLARQANAIRQRDGLASWLHGVAHRIALKSRRATVRRRQRETYVGVAESSASLDDLSFGEVRAILHAELAALPERYREPLVLCYLEGLTQDEAGQRLGWTPNSVKGRLQRGRQMLRHRLARRGLGLPATLGAAALAAGVAEAAVSQTLIETTVSLASSPTAPSSAALLAKNVAGPAMVFKLKSIVPLLLLGIALAGGIAFVTAKRGQQSPAPPVANAKPMNRNATDLHGDTLPEGAVARLGTIRFNHGEGLDALLYTSDGKTIVSKGGGFVRTWDAETGKELRNFATAKSRRDDDAAVLLPDNQTLLVLSRDFSDTLRTWDLVQGKMKRSVVLQQRGEWSAAHHGVLSPDGKLCALQLGKVIHVFDVASGKELHALTSGTDEFVAATFAGTDRIVTAKRNKTIEVWEAATGKLIRECAPGARADVLTASLDGRFLTALQHGRNSVENPSETDVVRVWDLETGKLKHTFAAPSKNYYNQVAFSPDGRHLITARFGNEKSEAAIWNVETGERIGELDCAYLSRVAISGDGTRLVGGGPTGKFEQWDLKTRKRISPGESRDADAMGVFLSPAGDTVCTSGLSTITTWDGTTGRKLRSFETPGNNIGTPAPQFSRDGRIALTVSGDWQKHPLHIWDVAAQKQLLKLEIPDASPSCMAALSPDGTLLATAPNVVKGAVIRLWDVATAKEVRTIDVTKDEWISHIQFSGDGKTLFVTSLRVVGYEVATGKELFRWKPAPGVMELGGGPSIGRAGMPIDAAERFYFRAAAVSADGLLFAGIQADRMSGRSPAERIMLCEARTGKTSRRWGDSNKFGLTREQVAFSHDGRLLATSVGPLIHVWDVATGKEIQKCEGHRNDIPSLAFSADNRRLASASSDSTVLIWDVSK